MSVSECISMNMSINECIYVYEWISMNEWISVINRMNISEIIIIV